MASKAFRAPPKCSVVMRIYGIINALYNKAASETGFLNANVIGYIVHHSGEYVKRKLALIASSDHYSLFRRKILWHLQHPLTVTLVWSN